MSPIFAERSTEIGALANRIGGAWVPSAADATLTTLNPAIGDPIVKVPPSVVCDVDSAVRVARTPLTLFCRETSPLRRASAPWFSPSGWKDPFGGVSTPMVATQSSPTRVRRW
jgi:hypothetical protein